jgi:hypothetical protein
MRLGGQRDQHSRDRVDVLPQHLGGPHAQEVFGLSDDAAENLSRWLHGMDQSRGVACAYRRDAGIAGSLGGRTTVSQPVASV